jgi:hypothetical protein
MGHIKTQLNESLESNMRQTFHLEATMLGLGGGQDAVEAMAAYREKRDPTFGGR